MSEKKEAIDSKDSSLDYEYSMKKPPLAFTLPEYLLIAGGPVNLTERVRRALSFQPLNPLGTDIFNLVEEIKVRARYIFQTKNELTFAIQLSGNGGNETIVRNLVQPGETIVVGVGGSWGEYVVEMATAYKCNVVALHHDSGEIFTLDELERAVRKHKPKLLFLTHGETTDGTLQNLEGIGSMCHKYGTLLAVDAVVSIACEPLHMDRWEVDAVSGGSQKAIGAPPGLCLLSFSERARKAIYDPNNAHEPPNTLNVKKVAQYWLGTDLPPVQRYHQTYSSNLLASLNEALAEICEEGLENVWERHRRAGEHFWKRCEEIGYELWVKKVENRFHGVTPVYAPKGIDWKLFLKYIRSKYSIEITAGHGPTTNKAIRMGFLGQNSRIEVVDYVIEAMIDAQNHFKNANASG